LHHGLGHKFKNTDGIYFTTFSVVAWVDIFTRGYAGIKGDVEI
jgi:hypothetical protein